MKLLGYRIIVFLIMVVLLTWPVQANVLPPDMMSIVHIEKDGIPYTESINNSLNCYGYTTNFMSRTYYLRNKTQEDPNPPQLVFSLSLSKSPHFPDMCDSCYVGYHSNWDPVHSELCQLNGTTKKGAFSVWNSSDKPAVNHTRFEKWPYNIYEFYFTLPPDSQTLDISVTPTMSSYNLTSPIESLYCSLLNLFGAEC